MAWTTEEDNLLMVMYDDHTQMDMVRALKTKTLPAVRTRLSKLGLNTKYRPWSVEDIAELKRAYSTAEVGKQIDVNGLAKKFRREAGNVSRKAREYGLTCATRPYLFPEDRRVKKNKYATKEDLCRAVSVRIKKYIEENGHPKGMKGKNHSPECKSQIAKTVAARWADPNNTFNTPEYRQKLSDNIQTNHKEGKMRNGYSRARGGKRPDIRGGMYFRSAWEANYARYLTWMEAQGEIDGWEYEPQTFYFENIKRGTRAYTPDFKVIKNGCYEWHEVKGWMDQASKTRLRRMEKYYPEEKVLVIGSDWFRSANKTIGSIINGWESGTTR